MASSITDRTAPAVVPNGVAPPLRASRLPPALRVPIFVVLSLSLSSLLLSFSANFIGNELGDISHDQGDLGQALTMLGSKAVLLWFGWYAKFDYVDIASLTVIANAPYAYLLLTYYKISALTVASLVASEVLSTAIPTFLLRPRSAIHDLNKPLPSRFLLNSSDVQWSTAALATGSYVFVLYLALKMGRFNAFLITHFDVKTMEDAHNEGAGSLALKLVGVGIAAREFLLYPSFGARAAPGTAALVEPFDPATATLPATMRHNFWSFGPPTKMLVRQTTLLNAFLFATTVPRILTITGTDLTGAAGYASLWMVGTLIASGWCYYVNDTDV